MCTVLFEVESVEQHSISTCKADSADILGFDSADILGCDI